MDKREEEIKKKEEKKEEESIEKEIDDHGLDRYSYSELEIERFNGYVKKSFQSVSLSLKDSPQIIQRFISFLFQQLLLQLELDSPFNSNTSFNHSPSLHLQNEKRSSISSPLSIRVVLTWCTWLICGGENPEDYLEKLKNETQAIVCSQVWNDGYYFYRCRDCGLSPSSSICFDCFKDVDHKGHEVVFERSVYGGCCDCGNPFAWKKEGFCRAHSGQYTQDPSLKIPTSQRNASIAVIEHLILLLCHFASKWNWSPQENESLTVETSLFITVVNWLRYIGSSNEALLHIIRQTLIKPPKNDSSISFHTLLEACLHIPLDVADQILFLFLDVLRDPSIKPLFIRHYVSLYSKFTFQMTKITGGSALVYKLSPQLFSVPELTIPLSKEEERSFNILDVMINSICMFFENLSRKDESNQLKVDYDIPYTNSNNYYAFINDLNTILAVPDIAKQLIYERQDLLSTFFRLLSFIQGSDPITRQLDIHVEYESQNWKSAFALELEFNRSITLLLDVFKGMSSTSSLQENTSFLQFSQMLSSSAKNWIEYQCYHFLKMEKDLEIIKYNVSSNPVSFHLPIHRTLSAFIQIFALQFPNLPISHLFSSQSNPSQFYLELIEAPLHIQVLLSQARSDLWIRNGLSLMHRIIFYRASFWTNHFFADITLIQMGLSLISPKTFFATIYDRFELREDLFQEIADEVALSKETLYRLEDFLRFIITIASERYKIGSSDQEFIIRELVHILALDSTFTHSRLVGEISQRIVESKHFDEILNQVAEYREPSSDTPGTFQLRKEYWKYFDPYYPRYDVQNLQIALDRYSTFKPKIQPKLVLPPLLPQFSQITSILYVDQLFNILQLVLEKIVTSKDVSTESILRASLHIILLHLDNLDHDNDSLPNLITFLRGNVTKPKNILNNLIAFYKNEIWKEHKDYLIPILHRISCCDHFLHEIVLENLPEFSDPEAVLKGEVVQSQEDIEERRRIAKERQAAIMAKFKNQQSNFLKTSQIDDTPNKIEEEQDESCEEDESDDYETMEKGKVCSLCRTTVPSNQEGAILGLIALLQSSNVPSVYRNNAENLVKTNKYHKDNWWMMDKEDKQAIHSLVADYNQPSFKLADSSINSPLLVSQREEEGENNESSSSEEEEGLFGDHLLINPPASSSVDSSQIPTEGFDTDLVLEEKMKWMMTDSEPNYGANILFCGHCMHEDCFNLFFASLNHTFHNNQTRSPTNLDRGEFFCPVCRRLSNILVPIIRRKRGPQNSSEIVFGEWLSQQITKSNVQIVGLTENVDETHSKELRRFMEDVYRNLSKVGPLSGVPNVLIHRELHQSVASIITCIEIASRWQQYQLLFTSSSSSLVCYIRSCLESTNTIANRRERFQLVLKMILGDLPVSFQSKAFLSCDLFGLFVNAVLLWSDTTITECDFLQLVKLFWIAQTFQLFSSQNIQKFENNESFVQSFISSQTGELNVETVPFLRKCYIFHQLLNFSQSPNIVFPDSIEDTELLLKCLQLPTNALILNGDIQILLEKWANQFTRKTIFPRFFSTTTTGLIELPASFQDFLFYFMSVSCPQCNTVPEISAICLVCGEICCLANPCCYENGLGECFKHSRECGGAFLMPKSTFTLILREDRRSVWNSIYVDERGEEDPNIRRGKPLFLDKNRFNELQKLWITGTFDYNSKIASSTVRDAPIF
eukprot:TRINITY_DN1925_c0_g2_i1.p1 TRINITY_DN1925_c0_g2~~TRINITY_DN1925_c0_g2_i1.p1  ORF type:complete len:1678 (-),score=263.05 TRINITY_DN1925_c0_g2_i1:3052-8085(-)